MGHGKGRKKKNKVKVYHPQSAEEYMRDPRPTCTWCNEPASDIAKRTNMFELEVHGRDVDMVSCLACWESNNQEI